MIIINIRIEYGYSEWQIISPLTIAEFEAKWKTIDLSRVRCSNCSNILDDITLLRFFDEKFSKPHIYVHAHQSDDTFYEILRYDVNGRKMWHKIQEAKRRYEIQERKAHLQKQFEEKLSEDELLRLFINHCSTKDVLKLLANCKKIDINHTFDENDCPMLIRAICFGNFKIFKALLSVPNININIINVEDGSTPLHEAAYCNKIEELKLLIKFPNINLNPLNKSGSTPLIEASYCNNTKAIEVLASTPGVNASIRNELGHAALDISSHWKNKRAIEIIKAISHN